MIIPIILQMAKFSVKEKKISTVLQEYFEGVLELFVYLTLGKS
jgi:hypothetical protein